MTENKAIKGLEILRNQCKHKWECGTCDICFNEVPMAIQALEEIQQYRAIGTVEEIREIFSLCNILSNVVKDYSAIGTVEELQALKEKSEPKKPKMIGYLKDGEPIYECGCCGSTLKVADQPFCMICSCKVAWQ